MLRRRVDMGNERRPAEVRLFQMLFSQGDVCEGVSLLYKRTAEKADEVLRRYWVRRMYRKTSGNPLIMRALGILAGALTAAEAASPILPSGFVRWLLLAVIFVLGGVLFAVIQYAPAAYYQGKWPLAGLAAACAAALLAMAQLGEGVLVMLLVIACEVLIGVLTLHGGRRTAFGDEIVAQALGYRKFLRRVTQSQLQSRLAQDSQYFTASFRMPRRWASAGALPGRSATRRWSSATGTRAPSLCRARRQASIPACARRSL